MHGHVPRATSSISFRSRFHFARIDPSGKTLDEHDVLAGSEDVGGEPEVHKTGTGWFSLVTVARNTRWGTGPSGAIDTHRGATMLLGTGESADIGTPAGETVAYLGLGWEVEVLKSDPARSVVALAVSTRR